jgi:hypothetical protein
MSGELTTSGRITAKVSYHSSVKIVLLSERAAYTATPCSIILQPCAPNQIPFDNVNAGIEGIRFDSPATKCRQDPHGRSCKRRVGRRTAKLRHRDHSSQAQLPHELAAHCNITSPRANHEFRCPRTQRPGGLVYHAFVVYLRLYVFTTDEETRLTESATANASSQGLPVTPIFCLSIF